MVTDRVLFSSVTCRGDVEKTQKSLKREMNPDRRNEKFEQDDTTEAVTKGEAGVAKQYNICSILM